MLRNMIKCTLVFIGIVAVLKRMQPTKSDNIILLQAFILEMIICMYPTIEMFHFCVDANRPRCTKKGFAGAPITFDYDNDYERFEGCPVKDVGYETEEMIEGYCDGYSETGQGVQLQKHRPSNFLDQDAQFMEVAESYCGSCASGF